MSHHPKRLRVAVLCRGSALKRPGDQRTALTSPLEADFVDVKNNLSLEKILSGIELWFKQEGQVHGKVCAVVASRDPLGEFGSP